MNSKEYIRLRKEGYIDDEVRAADEAAQKARDEFNDAKGELFRKYEAYKTRKAEVDELRKNMPDNMDREMYKAHLREEMQAVNTMFKDGCSSKEKLKKRLEEEVRPLEAEAKRLHDEKKSAWEARLAAYEKNHKPGLLDDLLDRGADYGDMTDYERSSAEYRSSIESESAAISRKADYITNGFFAGQSYRIPKFLRKILQKFCTKNIQDNMLMMHPCEYYSSTDGSSRFKKSVCLDLYSRKGRQLDDIEYYSQRLEESYSDTPKLDRIILYSDISRRADL